MKLTKESKTKNKNQENNNENEDQFVFFLNKKLILWIQGWNCKNKIKFDKKVKNQILKSKHWGPNFKYHQILNWIIKSKRKIKFIKESKFFKKSR